MADLVSGVSSLRVLVVATNVERMPSAVYPLGASIIAGALRGAGMTVRGLDLAFAASPAEDVAAAVRDFDPELIAVSIRAVDNATLVDSRSYLPGCLEIVRAARECTRAPIVLGGGGYSLFPQRILDRSAADFGIVGEGEAAVVRLASRLASGDAPGPDDGVLLRGAPLPEPRRANGPLPPAAWARPDYDAFPLRPYLEAGGTASVQTKRGCGQKCTYCTYPLLEGRSARLRPPADVRDDVLRAVDQGADYFYIVDSTFNLPAPHAIAVCRVLATPAVKSRWTAYVTPLGFDPEQAGAMAAAGCASVEVGSEAATPATLAGMGKEHSPDDILRIDGAFVDAGITPAHFFVFGGPGETEETLEASLGLIDRLAGVSVVMIGLRVYPGTELHGRALRDGLVAPGDVLLEPTFYVSPRIDTGHLTTTLMEFAASRPRCHVLGISRAPDPAIVERLRRAGRRGPLWEFLARG